MKKLLLIIFILVFGISAGIFAYYLFSTRSPSGLISQNNSPSPTNQMAGLPTNVKTSVLSDCKEIPVFSGKEPDVTYVTKLFVKLGGDVMYDEAEQALVSPSNSMFSIQYLNSEGKAAGDTQNGLSCLYVFWSGKTANDGKIAYETKTGEIKVVPVPYFSVVH